MTGALRFDQYHERCLYDPGSGFYARTGASGRRRGDFITSPEVGPLFGEVVANALEAWWREAGEPPRWRVVEAGAGRGALARAVLDALAGRVPLELVCVERSERLRTEAAALLDSRATVLPATSTAISASKPTQGDLPHAELMGVDVVLANELLDNLPVRILERTVDGWAEVWVPDELRDTSAALDVDCPVGTRLPLVERAAAWVAAARAAARRVVCLDYFATRTADLVGTQWLRTYRSHAQGCDPYDAPGTRDITVDVPVDQLPAPHAVTAQRDWLALHGIGELVQEGLAAWDARAQIGDLAAVRARSRAVEAAALCDAAGLGGFLVCEWEGER